MVILPGGAFDDRSSMLMLMLMLILSEMGVATTIPLGKVVDGTTRPGRAVSHFAGLVARLSLGGTTTRMAAAENW